MGLGLTPSEVVKILGPPSTTRPDLLVYSYTVKIRRTKEQIEAAKREAPYATPDLEYDNPLLLMMRFRNGRLWYLYETSETC